MWVWMPSKLEARRVVARGERLERGAGREREAKLLVLVARGDVLVAASVHARGHAHHDGRDRAELARDRVEHLDLGERIDDDAPNPNLERATQLGVGLVVAVQADARGGMPPRSASSSSPPEATSMLGRPRPSTRRPATTGTPWTRSTRRTSAPWAAKAAAKASRNAAARAAHVRLVDHDTGACRTRRRVRERRRRQPLSAPSVPRSAVRDQGGFRRHPLHALWRATRRAGAVRCAAPGRRRR